VQVDHPTGSPLEDYWPYHCLVGGQWIEPLRQTVPLVPLDDLHPVGAGWHRYGYILVPVHIDRDDMRICLAIEQLNAVTPIFEIAVLGSTLLLTVTVPDAGKGSSAA
jgi:hypothetical protein